LPTLPKSNTCEALRCKEARAQGSAFCETHGGKPKQSAARFEANAPYKTAAWQAIRAAQLSAAPLCASCLCRGVVTQAAHVDHVIPWRAIGPAAFKRNLFQSLCASCHTLKTAAEQKGVYIHYTQSGPKEYTRADYLQLIPR